MTREAKIGLLVALSFLLVIGILLSDHVTVATREPAAPLANTADTVRGSIRAPGDSGGATTAGGAITPVLPENASRNDPRHGSSSRFVYDGPRDEGQVHIEMGTPAPNGTANSGARHQPEQFVGHYNGGQYLPPDPGVDAWQPTPLTHELPRHEAPAQPLVDDPFAEADDIPSTGNIFEDLAREMGEPLVREGNRQSSQSQEVAGVADYVAQPGDSLSRITARILGRDTPANREVILKLNPKLRENPDLIVVGQSYKVPADSQAARTLAQAQASRPQTPAGSQEASRQAPAATPRTYTVQSGDSLWRIAERELGNPSRRSEILTLNRNVISDEDQLQVGMVLRLPD